MPSNHTPNYQLSQWEKSDKVLMEDFNADNAKIDAAIQAVERRADDLAAGKGDPPAGAAHRRQSGHRHWLLRRRRHGNPDHRAGLYSQSAALDDGQRQDVFVLF